MKGDFLNSWLRGNDSGFMDDISLGLERVEAVRRSMSLLLTCPVVIVGGTNGKGSVCAMLDSIFRSAGYKVGLYTSPHISSFSERVKVSGHEATREDLIKSFERVRAKQHNIRLTYFEFATLVAVDYFSINKVDVAILEVGMGGRLDAVNIFDRQCTILTSVGLDHVEFLGATVDKIASEKAGIFRKNIPAVCGIKNPPESILKKATSVGCLLSVIDKDFGYEPNSIKDWLFWDRMGKRILLPWPSLKGKVQLNNAAVAVAAVRRMGNLLPVDLGAIRNGLVDIRLRGRLEISTTRPQVILDVCHNVQAAECLATSLSEMPVVKKTVAIVGLLAKKDIKGIIGALKKTVDLWITVELKTAETARSNDLKIVFSESGIESDSIIHMISLVRAYEVAKASVEENDRILVFGSFFLVSEALETIENGGSWQIN